MIKLKPYQQDVLDDLCMLPSIALFMGTGSGKTFTSLFKVMSNDTPHLLVICPARSIGQWHSSIRELLPNFKPLEFPKRATAKLKDTMIMAEKSDHMTVVVSLNIIANLPSLLKRVDKNWTIIVDESHRIKELGTRRSPVKVTKRVLELGVKTPYKAILTATPTQKQFGGYVDYFTQLTFLGYLKMSYKQFEERYCVIKLLQIPGTPYPIPQIIGYKNTKELDALLGTVARRYVPKFTDGEPEFIVEYFDKPNTYTILNKERFYKDLNLQNLSAMRVAKKTLTSGVVLGRTIDGDQRIYPDNTEKIDWVKDFLLDTDETVVIFYKYNVELDQLRKVCEELKLPYIVLNGANQDKAKSINSPYYRVVLGQYNACGESIDGLQHRSHITIYYAMPESSLEYTQSLGRINRMGQMNLPIYYHLVMKNTIDEDIYKMTLKKVAFNEEVLNKLNTERSDA